MEQDRIRWDNRYADGQAGAPTPPEALAHTHDLLSVIPSAGRALDLASGAGAQSLWLAERGFEVVALDVSPVAIALLREASILRGVDASIDARVHDTDHGLPPDLTELSMIVCQRYRAVDLYGEMIDRLRVGGVTVLTVLSAVGLDGDPGEFHAPAGELIAAFDRDDVEVLRHVERDGLASIVARRIS